MPAKRILLVEDDLLAQGYRVDPSATVAGARMLLAGGGYDLVLADGVLPDGSGMMVADEAER
jgi:DNA-binding response OmpR family regulator